MFLYSDKKGHLFISFYSNIFEFQHYLLTKTYPKYFTNISKFYKKQMQRTGFSFERVVIEPLKGVSHKIFDLRFFHESVFPWPLSILLGPFQIFLKILGDIFNFVFIAVTTTLEDILSLVSLTTMIRPCSEFSSSS